MRQKQNVRKSNIIEIAKPAAKKIQDGVGMEELCGFYGVSLRIMCIPDERIKAYYFYQSRIHNIVINQEYRGMTRKILIAHELGHFLLHMDIMKYAPHIDTAIFGNDKMEAEANLFAAEILVPDDMSDICFPPELLMYKAELLKEKGFHVNYDIPDCRFLKSCGKSE